MCFLRCETLLWSLWLLLGYVPLHEGWWTAVAHKNCHVSILAFLQSDHYSLPGIPADLHATSVPTSVGMRRLCPPTSDPAAVWCTPLLCPVLMSLLEHSLKHPY